MPSPAMVRSGWIALFIIIGFVVVSQCMVTKSLRKTERFGSKRYYNDPMVGAVNAYVTSITIGGQDYYVMIDTGSTMLYITGRNCSISSASGCYYSYNFYEGTNYIPYSSNYGCASAITWNGTPNVCSYTTSYLDGSGVAAVAMNDTATLGEYSANILFGVAYSMSTGFLEQGMDGLWGIGARPGFGLPPDGPVQAWGTQGMPQVFAMCLSNPGGELHLGGFDTSYVTNNVIQWEPYISAAGYFTVAVSQITVGTTVLSASSYSSPQQWIMDSGTTSTYLSSDLFAQIMKTIKAVCPSCDTNAYATATSSYTPYASITPSPDQWPSVTIAFTSASVTIPGAGLWVESLLYPGYYAQALYDTGSNTTSGLIGMSSLINWYTVFDLTNNQLGFGAINAAKCAGLLPDPGATNPVLQQVTPSTPKPPTTDGTYITPVTPPPPQAPTPSTSPSTTPAPSSGSSPSTPPAPTSTPPSGSPPSNPPSSTVTPSSASQITASTLLIIISILGSLYL